MCIEILKMSGLLNVGNQVRCLRKVVFPLLEGGDLYPSKWLRCSAMQRTKPFVAGQLS